MRLAEIANHHRHEMESRFAAVADSLRRAAWSASGERFAALRGRIEAHMSIEERDIFPLLDRLLPQRDLIAALRREHARFREVLAYVGACIDMRDASAASFALERLFEQLENHDAREEWILFPMCERLLDHEHLSELSKALGAGHAGPHEA